MPVSMFRVAGLLVMVAAAGCSDETGGGDAGGGNGTGSTGTGGGAIPCTTGDRSACPGGSPAAGTALATYTALRAVAEGTGEPTRWMGGIMGQQIGRDGRPSTELLTIWIVGFCLGEAAPIMSDADIDDSLSLSTNGAECLAERGCKAFDCAGSQNPAPPEPVPPAIDSDAAITAAFPAEPATALYGLSYTDAIGKFWSVTSLTSSTTVKIDGTTGAVVP